jgi:cell division septum initiation protein DivIVA
MTDDADLMLDLDSEDVFEMQMRGYSRRQVNEFVASTRNKIRMLEDDLGRSREETERVRSELVAARQGLSGRPAHEEISERVGQILKLADEEAKAQRARAQEEIGQQRDEAKKDTDRMRSEAREQAERMLTAAQEQAENAIAAARAEAEKMRNSARIETERAINEASKEADNTLASAKAQAKQMLDEATARATAIHDGAERRLNLLMSRHTETMRRLTEIRDVVTNLVSSEASRGSLEDEVAKSVASSFAAAAPSQARGNDSRPAPVPAPRPGAREADREPATTSEMASVAATRFGQRPGGDDRSRPTEGDGTEPTRPSRAGAPGAPPAGAPARGDNVRVLPD